MLTSKGVALITGCAQGIGRATAFRLASDGFHLALSDLPSRREDVKALASELSRIHPGIATSTLSTDVRDEGAVKNMVESASEALGGIDVLVASAGIIRIDTLSKLSEKDWDDTFSVNVKGVLFCYKHGGNQMIKQGRGGRIIGLSSLAGKKGVSSLGAYCASKFAVRGLTQVAASELGPHGITVNACAPGLIQTPMLKELSQGYSRSTGGSVDVLSATTQSSALGVQGQAEDVADLISFLASKESRFVTGEHPVNQISPILMIHLHQLYR
ncbi:acetoin reductase family protein [Coniophora puteana RWD-64-598 SS2]|uniref:Acetoin reductase family protein n=1 Tax=Coniophora puteana (strain RWD-64-598) TaxID=741705 RepID=A0A5M3MUP5_CONPW|nr:acetoin reductase family protein [Coniophora puteana RWD-64-598 SS2]EIW82760.1 acetoin reductase family protein [Coniophora puteana RWD-64-598 SS2]